MVTSLLLASTTQLRLALILGEPTHEPKVVDNQLLVQKHSNISGGRQGAVCGGGRQVPRGGVPGRIRPGSPLSEESKNSVTGRIRPGTRWGVKLNPRPAPKVSLCGAKKITRGA